MMKMRDATKKEQDSVNNYIKSISKPTGINFDDFDDEVEELDFVAEHPKIPVEIHVTKIK